MNKQISVFSGVVIKKGKVLMVLRNEPELPEAHLKWEFPGGKCEYNETPREAVEREVLEEAGVKVYVKELIPFIQTSYWHYPKSVVQTLSFCFLCDYREKGSRRSDHHIIEVAWVPLNGVKSLQSLPGTNEIIGLIADSF